MTITIPGRGKVEISNVLLDYNGTIAEDGMLLQCIESRIRDLSKLGVDIHLLTADTHGTARKQCADLPMSIRIFDSATAAQSKRDIAMELGGHTCACIGNGFNDRLMFEVCEVSIAVAGREGLSVKALNCADILCTSIEDALDMFIKRKRMIATLRG